MRKTKTKIQKCESMANRAKRLTQKSKGRATCCAKGDEMAKARFSREELNKRTGLKEKEGKRKHGAL